MIKNMFHSAGLVTKAAIVFSAVLDLCRFICMPSDVGTIGIKYIFCFNYLNC
jgi:hypothetical protein